MIDLKESFHSINLKRKNYFDEVLEQTELNMMELEVIVHLDLFPENNTFTDIMKSKDYAKSYVSKAISHLVELGYIKKEVSPTNKKVHNLFLLEKGKPMVALYDECVQHFRDHAFEGVSREEYEVFERVIGKISRNLEEKTGE